MALTERPANGAATAIWSPERNEFRRCPPVNGEDDGEARLNRPDGTLACVVPYEQGKSNERFTPFLQNRRPSKTDTKAGKEDGRLTWYRPAPSAETTATTLPDACATSVVEMRAEFVDGVAGPVEFYDTVSEQPRLREQWRDGAGCVMVEGVDAIVISDRRRSGSLG